jgi:hypothetical protein
MRTEEERIKHREYMREYRKTRRRDYSREYYQSHKDMYREYSQRPEVKEKYIIKRDNRKLLSLNIKPCKMWGRYGCGKMIKKHHIELQHDPERLTTEFLIWITGCECKRGV